MYSGGLISPLYKHGRSWLKIDSHFEFVLIRVSSQPALLLATWVGLGVVSSAGWYPSSYGMALEYQSSEQRAISRTLDNNNIMAN